ncbi:toll/interleukin-1 receptor domain-containing protein, partial [Rodentibacter caecimuris]|uniref:toll/interleukin-1 receptor domain-containing protein n=1 Tax=Rodentibacter caecimuris TaxID=1796644 RepID=UPI00101AD621
MSLNVFISYAKEDQKIAIQYYNWLENENFNPWLDVKKLKGGQNWALEIDRAFKKAHVIIWLMSPQSICKRGFVQREVKEALDNLRYKQPDDIYMIPIIIENCNVPDYISDKLQFINNSDGLAFDSLKSSLLTAAEQQSISITSGTPIGPYLVKTNEIKENWNENLGYELDISYPT